MHRPTPIFWIDPKWCEPPHRVTNTDHLDDLLASIRTIGWDGPPLTGYLNFGRITLLSGSHRFAAALKLGIKLPIEVHSLTEVSAVWGDPSKWKALIHTAQTIRCKFGAIDKAEGSVVG